MVLNMRSEGWYRTNFRMAYGMAHNVGRDCLYVAAPSVQMWPINIGRTMRTTRKSIEKIHNDKAICVDVNSRSVDPLSTESSDDMVCL